MFEKPLANSDDIQDPSKRKFLKTGFKAALGLGAAAALGKLGYRNFENKVAEEKIHSQEKSAEEIIDMEIKAIDELIASIESYREKINPNDAEEVAVFANFQKHHDAFEQILKDRSNAKPMSLEHLKDEMLQDQLKIMHLTR